MSDSRPDPDFLHEDGVRFDFVKSGAHRTIHVDGVWGGPTPNGSGIAISLFAERHSIPQQVVYKATKQENGSVSLSEEIAHKVSRPAIVREVEATILLSPKMAVTLRDWLNRHIKQYEEAVSRLSSEGASE